MHRGVESKHWLLRIERYSLHLRACDFRFFMLPSLASSTSSFDFVLWGSYAFRAPATIADHLARSFGE